MTRRRGVPQPARRVALAATAVVVGLILAGCSSSSESAGEVYLPAVVEEVADGEVSQVTFTADAAARVGLATATVRPDGAGTVVPYAALIYDGSGAPWVYQVTAERTYQRTAVVVDRIEGDSAWLTEGPPAGAGVVTVGATEVYGAELGIGGGH